MVMLVLVTPGTERAVTALAEPASTPADMSPNDSDDAASTVMRRRKRLLDIASPLREFGIRRDDSETSWRLQQRPHPVSYTHLRAHETVLDLVCRLLLEKKKK